MQEYIRTYGDYITEIRQLNIDKSYSACVITFGCQQNEADSERVRGIAMDMGYRITDIPDEADLIIVNTCAIREHAEMKVLSSLGAYKALKKKNENLIVGVIGCMAAESHIVEQLKTKFHYVTFTIEPNMLHTIPMVVYRALTEKKRTFIIGKDEGKISEGLPCMRQHKHKAWVSIMYGCNNFCSYCIVPYTRGRERSRASDDILAECRTLIKDGCHEITLLGQNVNSYKSDTDFAGLLQKIAEIDGDFLIRFMTSHPKDVSDRLIEVMATYPKKIAPYFHLPLQSGSNRILELMHRTYTREHFLSIVDKLRSAIPNICLSTDVIVGFPGEDDNDFEDTMDILRRVGFDIVYAFRFSPRAGTPAARMDSIVPPDVVSGRMDRLLLMQDEISLARNVPYVGKILRVLVDTISKRSELGTFTARTSTNKLVHFIATDAKIGEFCDVKIERAGAFELLGKQI